MQKLSIGQVGWLLVGSPMKGRKGFAPSLLSTIGIKVGSYEALKGVKVTAADKKVARAQAQQDEAVALAKGRTFKTTDWAMKRHETNAAFTRMLNGAEWPKQLRTLSGMKMTRFSNHQVLVEHLNSVFPGVNFECEFETNKVAPTSVSEGLDVAAMITKEVAQQTQPVAAPSVKDTLIELHELHELGILTEEEFSGKKAEILKRL